MTSTEVPDHVGGPRRPGSEALLAQLLTTAPVALVHLDLDGVVTTALGTALSVEPDRLVGQRLLDLAETPEQAAPLERAIAGEEVTAVVQWGDRAWQARYRPFLEQGERTGTVAVYTDITEQVLAEQARAAGEAHLRAVLETAREAILVVDLDGRVTMANHRCAQLLGGTAVVGRDLRQLVDRETAAALDGQLLRRSRGFGDRYELRLRDRAGGALWLLVSANPLIGPAGEPIGSVAVLTDITAAKEEQSRLSAAALTDPLTGVGNRAALTSLLLHALARRGGPPVAVLFCDVDTLKDVNDRHGHAAGDALLRHVARSIGSVLRPEDTLVRYAGDEFVVVCEGLTSADEALALAERVRVAVLRPPAEGPAATVSIGVAFAAPPAPAEQLLGAADGAAYEAKRAGRDRVRTLPVPRPRPARRGTDAATVPETGA